MLCTDGTNWKQSGMVVLFPTSPHQNGSVWFYSTAKPYTKQAPNVNGRYPSTKFKYDGYGLDAIQWSSITVDGLGLCRRPKLPLLPVCGPVVWCDAQMPLFLDMICVWLGAVSPCLCSSNGASGISQNNFHSKAFLFCSCQFEDGCS